ncbi:F-box protein CPR1-like [Rhododendron vialii]|uniref:F-box protein CPR1-like n=1 Tax=Rhododendron vialii TaxID=182163 RepID=UPI0026602335|nr:F-box protein CPR1-like [Rhododendron vialii]XP_058182237.1 F-box protein CPR1-like [Rhododendron vialii]XP_058182238.1 F-box protein CPR1-like [Rhododendron vialii]XP_058182239.1 F-box protein CPR1-like [Rhododendron vialii]
MGDETPARENKKKIRGLNIPDELVLDILSRLPVKSLLRFKSICKSWLSMISHPQFIRTHLHRSTQSPHCPRLLLKTNRSPLSFVSIDFRTPNRESESLQCPWENSDSFIQPLCSCDGLILLSLHDGHFVGTKSGRSFVLWNPSDRSHKIISCPYELPFCALYGLCYDSTAHDYKVFIVSQESETSVAIYSSRNNSWNLVMDNRYYLYASEHQAIVNGAVHWVMCSREFDSWVIVYFDLVEEKFKEVPPPSLWNEDDEMNLVVLRGFLCVYCDIGVRQIEVYAMKEYGKKESWARLFVIPCAIERRVPCSTYLKPLCLTKKGQVLVSVGKRRIGIYDPKDRTFLLYDSVRGRTAIPYVESLVSLNGGV